MAWTGTLLNSELTPGTHARELHQSVRLAEESRYCRWISRAQSTHPRRTCGSPLPAIETALRCWGYWEAGSPNSRVALLRIVVTFAKSPPVDWHALLAG